MCVKCLYRPDLFIDVACDLEDGGSEADSDEDYPIPDYDKPGPKAMLPFSSLYIFGPTNPWVCLCLPNNAEQDS